MKKFRVEVDGEEFIVNVEEISSEKSAAVSKTSNKKSNEKNKVVKEKRKANKDSAKIKKQTKNEKAAPAEIGEGDITAPMPGSILKIEVQKGDTVSKGDILIVLEAMKMENEITASQSGTVKDIKAKVGESVDAEDLLLVIE